MANLNESYEKGLRTYRAQRGTDFELKKSPHDPASIDDIAKLSISRCYGDVWSRPGLDMRTRAFITISLLAALGADDQLRNHIVGAHKAGITKDEIVEWLLHVNSYLGTPKGVMSLAIARQAWKQLAEEPAAGGATAAKAGA